MQARCQRRLDPVSRGKVVALGAAQPRSPWFATALNGLRGAAQALAFLRALVDPGRRNQIAAITGAGAFFGSQGLQP